VDPFARTITARISQAAAGFSRLTGYARTLPSGASEHPWAPNGSRPKAKRSRPRSYPSQNFNRRPSPFAANWVISGYFSYNIAVPPQPLSSNLRGKQGASIISSSPDTPTQAPCLPRIFV